MKKIFNDSITILSNSGIEYHIIFFAEYFLTSGLVLNDDITWISFNGLSDFAYSDYV